MPTALRALCLTALVFALAAPALADSWAAPQVTEVFSASRDHFVRVIPGKSVGDSAAKGAYAAADFTAARPRNNPGTAAVRTG